MTFQTKVPRMGFAASVKGKMNESNSKMEVHSDKILFHIDCEKQRMCIIHLEQRVSNVALIKFT
jgi:hypothetical protein